MASSVIRIAVLHFQHETVTFLRNDTTIDDFVYPGSPARGEALLASGPKSYMGGFVQVAREYDGVELVGIESPLWPKTGSGSGWVTQEAYETFVGRMIAQLKAEGPFDGVYLCVHGAMAARGIPRPEAELARRVREVVGRRAFIAATFDPHGNEDEEFLRYADLAFCGKYFPHYDSHLQGERAARILIRAIRGIYRPAHATVKVPIISPTVVQWTGASPWMDLVQRALTWEAREPDAYVNVYFGFPWSDVPDVGMTFQVITNGDADAGATHRRRHGAVRLATPRGAAALDQGAHDPGWRGAGEAGGRGGRNAGRAGGPQRSLGLRHLAAARDHRAGAVEHADRHRCGCRARSARSATRRRAMRSTWRSADWPMSRPANRCASPAPCCTSSQRHGQLWISVGFGDGNVLVISPYLVQIMEPSTLTELGLDLSEFQVIAIKSRVHFRRGFDDSGFARTILLVEPTEPFLGTVRLDALAYRNVDLSDFYPYGDPEFTVRSRA